MMSWVVKLQRHGGQFRVGLPRGLIEELGFENVEIVEVEKYAPHWILIREYYGKGKEKSGIQEDKS